MTRYLLDTDHVTLLQKSDSNCMEKLNRIDPGLIAITVVTVEESVRGWTQAIRQASVPSQFDRLVWAYTGLRSTVQYLAQFQLVDWTEESSHQFSALRRQGIRIGTQDLRIASMALSLDAIVVTRNHRDFSKVPGLLSEDWTI
jgi:tRNA(fMet)-specific endonuclease VapC